MGRAFTDREFEAYLDESLAPAEMLQIETTLRKHPELLQKLAAINSRRNAGVHTLGEIWIRHRLSCISREHLGSYLLGVLSNDHADYVRFHVESVGCRICGANLEDLRRQQRENASTTSIRRSKYFQSSAGYLRGDR